MTPPLLERLRALRERVAALLLDAALLAYALWALGELGLGRSDEGNLLSRHPGLLLATALLALWWQSGGASLGQRAYGLALLRSDGSPAGPARRGAWALVAATVLLAVFAPAALGLRQGVLFSLTVSALLGLLSVLGLRGRSLAEVATGAALVRAPGADPEVVPLARNPRAWIVLLLLALTFAVGAQKAGVRPLALIEGAGRTERLWNHLLAPDWSVSGRVLDLLVETVFLALMASALAVPFAFVLSFLAARNVTAKTAAGGVVYGLVRVLMNVTRSVEPIVWAIVFVLWVGIGPFAGMLALFVHSVASLTKLYSEAIEGIDAGPVEAMAATGARPLQVLRYGVVPQVTPAFLAFTVYRWDINVRMATILGFVGGGGIGDLLIHYVQLGAWSKVGTIVAFVTLVVWLLDVASARARARIV